MEDVRQSESEAYAAQSAGDFERAIQIWVEILEKYPQWEGGYAHYYLADCYTRTGRIDLAIEAYREAIALGPNDKLFSDALESLMQARNLGRI